MQEVTAPVGQLEFATDALRAEKKLPSLEELEPILRGKALNTYEGAPPRHRLLEQVALPRCAGPG